MDITCRDVVDGVTTVAGIGANFTPGGPLAGMAAGAALGLVGEGVKEVICPPESPPQSSQTGPTISAPVSLLPPKNSPNPPPVHRFAGPTRPAHCPTPGGLSGTCGLY